MLTNNARKLFSISVEAWNKIKKLINNRQSLTNFEEKLNECAKNIYLNDARNLRYTKTKSKQKTSS